MLLIVYFSFLFQIVRDKMGHSQKFVLFFDLQFSYLYIIVITVKIISAIATAPSMTE